MAEEKKKSFADMFKKNSDQGDSSGGKGSILDKLGIKRKDDSDGDSGGSPSSFAKRMGASKDSINSIAKSKGETSTEEKKVDNKAKIIARKSSVEATFADNLRRGRSELVYLVRGNDRGKAAWHYVYVDKGKKAMFLVAANSGSLDVADYGEVLYSGWGQDPPEEIVQKIKAEYNIT